MVDTNMGLCLRIECVRVCVWVCLVAMLLVAGGWVGVVFVGERLFVTHLLFADSLQLCVAVVPVSQQVRRGCLSCCYPLQVLTHVPAWLDRRTHVYLCQGTAITFKELCRILWRELMNACSAVLC